MEISEDILQYVFSWLPAKPIYRFKAVCKSSSEFSTNKLFAWTQARNLHVKDDSGFFLQPSLSTGFKHRDKVEYHSLPGEQLFSGVPQKSLQSLQNTGSKVLASSNGLILCQNTKTPDDRNLFLCNPTTQTWRTIPTPQDLGGVNWPKGVVLECNINNPISDPDHQDYMLLIIHPPRDWLPHYECKIYSPKEGRWKEKKVHKFGPRTLHLDMPVYHNGAVHFVSDCRDPSVRRGSVYYRPYIVAYDINNDTTRKLRLPNDARKGSDDTVHNTKLGIFKWGSRKSSSESICLVRLKKYVFTAWVLRDYDSVSWIRIMKIRVRAMGLMEPNPNHIAGFTVMNGKTLLFATRKKVYSYNMMGRSQQIEQVCEHQCQRQYDNYCNVCFTSYSNTLHPLGIGAATLPDI
ncbi:hypothetical protein PRUPE_2G273800 [Prunus persica]|uniref:F-box protein At3g26010-like beta-propeller domain-containing protein n=1 Tax=Prunus persica TaxID=3760 RepID=M5X545_PRUPE|nr:uncharacterized protein LOC18784766 [Prunus persica]ONI24995.1 hypothetical protein PRUPE_2G273800 [Prunus persica]